MTSSVIHPEAKNPSAPHPHQHSATTTKQSFLIRHPSSIITIISYIYLIALLQLLLLTTMAGIDDFIQRLPGNRGTKVLIASVGLLGLLGLPIFGSIQKGKQGEDLFSSDRPESIRTGQEANRKEERVARKLKEEAKKNQSS
jgi:hypothetical protein